jgi:cis-L-3-hydroxyproline dehydratase
MKITQLEVFQFTYSRTGGIHVMSGGKAASTHDSTIVKMSTDEGLTGWGEHCPFSPNYIVAHGPGARAAIHEMGPALIGLDPCEIDVVYERMNSTLLGHAYAKSAIDMACWDILGQAAGRPMSDMLGGTYRTELVLYSGVGIDTPEAMREKCQSLIDDGYRRLQIKVGEDWRLDLRRVEACLEVAEGLDVIIVDSNAFFRQHEAMHFVAALDDLPIYVEQPCRTMAECAAVRQRTRRPFILDESLYDIEDVVRAHTIGAMDAAMLKLSRFGGVSKIRQARDLCQLWGIAMTIEDSCGGDIASASMAHLQASTRPGYLLNAFISSQDLAESFAEGAPHADHGKALVPSRPGLGIQVDESALGGPEFVVK